MQLTLEKRELWQGPLPSPETVEEFQRLVPDAPERIFAQWEAESAHRRNYEKTALDGAIARDARGQYAAIAFALSALAVSAFALYLGYPAAATAISGLTVASVVGAFLYQRKASSKQ